MGLPLGTIEVEEWKGRYRMSYIFMPDDRQSDGNFSVFLSVYLSRYSGM